MLCWLFPLLLSLSVPPGQPKPAKLDPDRAKFQGTWRVVSALVDGNMSPVWKRATLTFRKDRLLIRNASTTEKPLDGPYRIDSSKTPKVLDFELIIFKAEWIIGIYSLDKDALTLCFGPVKERPTKFDGSKGTRCLLLKLSGSRRATEQQSTLFPRQESLEDGLAGC